MRRHLVRTASSDASGRGQTHAAEEWRWSAFARAPHTRLRQQAAAREERPEEAEAAPAGVAPLEVLKGKIEEELDLTVGEGPVGVGAEGGAEEAEGRLGEGRAGPPGAAAVGRGERERGRVLESVRAGVEEIWCAVGGRHQ